MVDGCDQLNTEVSISSGVLVGPILGTLDLHFFHQVSEHHDCRAVILPYHAPEVTNGVREWTLGGNVLFLTVVALGRGWGEGGGGGLRRVHGGVR